MRKRCGEPKRQQLGEVALISCDRVYPDAKVSEGVVKGAMNRLVRAVTAAANMG